MRITPILIVVSLAAILLSVSASRGACAAAEDGLSFPYTPVLRGNLFAYHFITDTDDAAALFVNPAGLGARRYASSLLSGTYWYDRLTELSAATSLPSLGLGYSYHDNGFYTSNTYLMGIGLRLVRQFHIGTSLRWHHADMSAEDRSPFSVDMGFLIRPSRSLSIGGVWSNANTSRFAGSRLEDTFTGGVSIRPFTERMTISGQGIFAEAVKPGWLVGGRITIAPGLELFGSYMRIFPWITDDHYEEFTGGVAFTFGSTTVRSSTRSKMGDYHYYSHYSNQSFDIENKYAYVENSLIHRDTYAEIEISGNYLDEGGWFTLSGGSKDLHRVLRELESARRDDDVKGVLLKVGPIESSFIGPVSANLHEIREAVMRVRWQRKPVVAYLTGFGLGAQMYIASAADRIVAPRETITGMFGVSLEINRMKRLFEKLGVDWDHYTAGGYKSTFHTYYTDTTSAEQAQELRSLVEEAHRLQVEAIAKGRGIDLNRMEALADGRIFSADEALEHRLIDVIGWEDDARKVLGRLAEAESFEDIATTPIAGRRYWSDRWMPAPAVAVVGAYGSIGAGKSERDFLMGGRKMGAATVVRQLKAAADQPGVRAIVFRVDSGGGWAFASDEILNEIRRIQRKVKIPVIVSMGNVAGSGGYWISMYGDAIFADPFTITGSIGVVFAKPVIERLYEKTGVTNEVFKSSEHADALSYGRMMTDVEREMLARTIEGVYDRFVGYVAEGRKVEPGHVREIAGGRVYLGTQALEIKLVDRIGGLRDAIEYAAADAGISEDYRTVYFRAFPGLFPFHIDSPLISAGRLLGLLPGGEGSGHDETITVR